MRSSFLVIWVVVLLISCGKSKDDSPALSQFTPADASLVLRINKLSNFKSEVRNNDYLKQVRNSDLYQGLTQVTKPLSYIETDTTCLLSLIREGRHWNMVMALPNEDFQLVSDSTTTINSSKINIEGVEITSHQIDSLEIFSAIKDGLMVLSNSGDVLATVMNLDRNSRNTQFEKLFRAANNSKSANIFFKYQTETTFPLIAFMNDSLIRIEDTGIWHSLDLDLNQGSIIGSGISLSNDSLNSFSNLFLNTNPLPNQIPGICPEGADGLVSYTFDSYDNFALNQKDYLKKPFVVNPIFNTVEELGYCYINGNKVVILSTYGSERILQFLQGKMSGSRTFQGTEIVQLNDEGILNEYFAPLIKGFKTANYTAIENFFVFSENQKSLEMFLQSYNRGAFFTNNKLFTELQDQLASEATQLIIGNDKALSNLIREENPKLSENTSKWLPKGYAFGSQTVVNTDFSHKNLIITKLENRLRGNSTSEVFRLQLDAPVANQPQFVINHRNRKKEIVVQDEENKLYLISGDGKVIWQKQLKGPVQGAVKQVDLYKNGKLQLAFTTNDQFLILDRNGKEVAPFTMEFKGGNLNPLAVFDYENNRNYRFVVTQGRKIFMYNSQGKIVSGFTYTEADSPVLRQPKHFRLGNKDYLVFQLENGDLKILNRLGKVRIPVKESFKFSENEVYLFRNSFAFTDQEGVLYTVNSRGELSRTDLNLDQGHRIDATSKTLATINENILSIKSRKRTLELGVYSIVKIFYLYDKIYVSVTDLQNEKVYLFDSQAKPISNFPVFGTSLISLDDIDGDRKLELVTKGQENDLIMYRMY